MRRLRDVRPETTELVPGRALLIKYNWTAARSLWVLVVYAPNAPADNATFWNALNNECQSRRVNVDILLGDFNVVENAIDRLPMRSDPTGATTALSNLLTGSRLLDSWRKAHPTDRAYTYAHNNGASQSRLDRIYVSNDLQPAAANWAIKYVGLPTDHALVTISIANYRAPAVGKGRWRMPETLLNDQPFLSTMKALGLAFQRKLLAINERTETVNPQTIYHSFKNDLREAARERTKAKAITGKKRLARLREQLDKTNSNIVEGVTNMPLIETSALLRERIHALEKRSLSSRRVMTAARYSILGEKVGRYWLRTGEPSPPDNTMYELTRPASGRPVYENSTP
ncbi:hypothetical protein ACG7TL_005558 [Trametes sanguinea]